LVFADVDEVRDTDRVPSRLEREQPIINGRMLAAALVTIALLAFVVPTTLALWLHRSRVTRATNQLNVTAAALDRSCLDAAAPRGELGNVDVLTGPGDPIERSLDPHWISPRTASLARCVPPQAAPVVPDPWLRPLLLNIGARRDDSTIWLLSAGPNGIIETPFSSATTTGGDDLGVRLTELRIMNR
jgi:hypothetical protein